MSLLSEQFAFSRDCMKLEAFIIAQGFEFTCGEAYRTPEQQAIYVQTGRSKTMDSDHLRRLAKDYNIFKDGKLIYDKELLQPIGNYWESLHPKNRWGGNWKSFKDVPHYERHV